MSINHEEFKKIFGVDVQSQEYIECVQLKDSDAVGFSIQRKYPNALRFKPPMTANGEPDVLAIIYVYSDSKALNSEKISIYLNIKLYSKYLSAKWDYDFNDSTCPTKESVELSKRTPQPVALESIDEYFYFPKDGVLKDRSGKVFSGKQVLDRLFEEHCSTIHLFKGLGIQFQIGSQKFRIRDFEFSIRVYIWLLRATTGRIFESKKDFGRGIFKPYQKEDMRLLSTEKVKFFDYELGSKNSMLFFCLLVFLGYAVHFFFSINLPFVKGIVSNNLVLTCTIILILWVIEQILPNIIFWHINRLIKRKLKVMFQKFKI